MTCSDRSGHPSLPNLSRVHMSGPDRETFSRCEGWGGKKHAQASESAAPFCWTYCAHVATPVSCAQLCDCPGIPVDVHTLPAQSPQRVVSKIAEWSWKNWNGLQVLAGQNALGVPHDAGMGAFAVISDGMLLRGKNQTLMPVSSHSTARRKTLLTSARVGAKRKKERERTGVDTTADAIERRAERVALTRLNTATLVARC